MNHHQFSWITKFSLSNVSQEFETTKLFTVLTWVTEKINKSISIKETHFFSETGMWAQVKRKALALRPFLSFKRWPANPFLISSRPTSSLKRTFSFQILGFLYKAFFLDALSPHFRNVMAALNKLGSFPPVFVFLLRLSK